MISTRLLATYQALESDVGRAPMDVTESTLGQAGLTVAAAWRFTQEMLPEVVPATQFPALAALSAAAERLSAFQAAPHGDGVCRAGA